MIIEERGLIFDAIHRPAQERVNAFTSLCRLRSGTILAGFQSGPAKHATSSTIRICRSENDGRTWHDMGMPFDSPLEGVPGSLATGDMAEVAPGRLVLFSTWFDRSDPDRPLFDPVTQGILHSKQVWAESADEGASWGEWRVLPTPGLTGCAATGPVLQWPDGTMAFAFESFKEYDDPHPARHGAWLAISRDRGHSYPELYLVAQHPEHRLYYWDQRLCIGHKPGEYYALFWTHDLEQQRDLTVHQRRGTIDEPDPRAMQIQLTPIPGQIAAPLLLDDGRLLAFVVDRDRPGTMRLWCSKDGGATWPASESLAVHTHDERAMLTQGQENIDFNEYWEDMAKWTFGHPAIRPLGNGRVLVAYYAGVPGTLSIHWARIDTRPSS